MSIFDKLGVKVLILWGVSSILMTFRVASRAFNSRLRLFETIYWEMKADKGLNILIIKV